MSEIVQRGFPSAIETFLKVQSHLKLENDPYWSYGLAKLLDVSFADSHEDYRGRSIAFNHTSGYLVYRRPDTSTAGGWRLGSWLCRPEIAVASEIKVESSGRQASGTFKGFDIWTVRQTTDRGRELDIPEVCIVYADDTQRMAESPFLGEPNVFCPIVDIDPETLRFQ